MNEERTTIINAALEGRLSPNDARRLLEALLVAEQGEPLPIIEPPCCRPPWCEAPEDLGALLGERSPSAILSTATTRILHALRPDHRDTLAMALAVLDVTYLSQFWTEPTEPGCVYGGMALQHQDAAVRLRSIGLVHSWPALGPDVFGQPLPIIPGGVRQSHEDIVTEATTVLETVSTRQGEFPNGLKVVRRVQDRQMHTLWLAPGVGIVLCHREDDNSVVQEMELVDYWAEGEGYFPLRPNNWWQFESRGPGPRVRELWRTLAPTSDGLYWLSVGACAPG